MGTILNRIVEQKEDEVENKRRAEPLKTLRSKAEGRTRKNLFQKAIGDDKIDLIAEIKPCSPSAGRITALAPEEIAAVYSRSLPAALSILTDEQFFGQGLDVLKKLRKKVSKPILRKDFIIDPYQVYEAAAVGADAILLIANILSPGKLEQLHNLAHELQLECLVEVHSKEEIETLPLSPPVLGINNRILEGDFSTDLSVTEELIEQVPEDSLVVSESGIHDREDILRLHRAGGVEGVLVGTALLEDTKNTEEIVERIRSLII